MDSPANAVQDTAIPAQDVPQDVPTAAPQPTSEAAGETAETARVSGPETPRDDLISQIMGVLEGTPGGLDEQQRRDAERHLSKWGTHAQQSGWAPTQQARFVLGLRGREVLSLTNTQATLVGGKVIYLSQLGA